MPVLSDNLGYPLTEKKLPIIYVIILNWNGWEDSIRCIRSLDSVSYPIHYLLIDNGSTNDSIPKLRAEFPDLDLIEISENLGFSGGNNVGIRYALQREADYILLLNNDTIVDSNFIQPMLQELEKNESVAAVNPKIYFLHDKNRLWAAGGNVRFWTAFSGNRGRGEVDKGQYDEIEPVDFGTGCCLLIRRTALEQIGLLNESYFAYYEDLDWSLRARRNGYKIVYVPKSKIWHAVGSASMEKNKNQQSPFIHYLVARNHLWSLRAYADSVRYFAFFAYFIRRLVYYTFIFILLRRWAKLDSLWRGFLDGISSYPQSQGSLRD